MNQSKSLLLAPVALAAALTAQAQETNGPFYLKAEAGAAFQQGLAIKGGDKMDFDTGFRFDIGPGWQFTPSLAAELEVGVIYNTVDSIGSLPVSSYGGSANFYQVPVLANLVFTLPLQGPLRPYIGAGVGGVATVVDLTTPLGEVNDSDFVFGYQALAGVQYALSEHVELGAAYKFLGTTDHHWSQDSVTLDTEPTYSHSVLVTLTWKF
jgi:opacity protein-like surface antigen